MLSVLCKVLGHRWVSDYPLDAIRCYRCGVFQQNLYHRMKQKRILAAQKARQENSAMLYEVMAVPEDERTESENQWVREYLEGRERYFADKARSNQDGDNKV
jgi:hypothetical protein